MPAKFHEIFGNSGIDDELHPPAMIVPLSGGNIVALSEGKGLHLESSRPNVKIVEIDQKMVSLFLAENQLLAAMKSGTRPLATDARMFRIDGKMIGGGSLGTEVKAVDARKRPEAKLLVVVLKQRLVKIAVRRVQVRDANKNIVFHSQRTFDIDELVRTMNLIWTPQANIKFELVSKDPILVDDKAAIAKAIGLKEESAPLPEDVNIVEFDEMFAKFKDPKADFTYFLVRRVIDRARGSLAHSPGVHGATNAKLGVVFVGDDMVSYTMAHEAGHALGYVGHTPESKHPDLRLLMNNGGPGIGLGKIPFHDVVQKFNTGYK